LLGASACGEVGQTSLSGVYTVDQALNRLLAGAPCSYHIVDAATIRITPIAAATPAPRGPTTVNLVAELMVTAQKRPERLDLLPAGVSVITGEQLRATGAGDAKDTAGQLVGVLMTNLGPGRDKLLMRGLSDGAFTGRARSTVSTYLDNAPVNYNAPDPDLKLTDVERVETVRGPQGALYGSGALAGVYRIVTNKPDPGRYESGVQALAATTKGGSPSNELEAYANLPLVAGRLGLRLVAYDDNQGGYLDDVSLRLSNVDSTSRVGGRAALRFVVSGNWTLDIAAAAQQLRSQDTQYTTLGAGKNRRANQVREASRNDFTQGSLTLRGDLGWADLTASTSYVQHNYSSLYDATAKASDFPISGANLGIYAESTRIHRLVQDVVLTSTGAGPFSWLAGVYGSSSTERTPSSLVILQSTGALTSANPTLSDLSPVYDENRRDRLIERAAYGEATWRLAPGWTAALGGRAFQSRLGVWATIVGAPPAQSRDVSESPSFSGVSAKLSLQYEFAGGQLIYGLYSDGFRPGGVNSTNFLTIKPQRTTFEPDQLRNYEFGAKGRFLHHRLLLRAAAFYDFWSNIQSDQYRPSGLAYTANVGDAHIRGLETEAAYDWDFGLSIRANALLSAPKFTHTNPDFADQLGSGLPGAPRVSGGIMLRYDRSLPHDLILRLIALADYVGPARLTFNRTLSAHTDPVVNAQLIAQLARAHWTASLYVSNPADGSGNTFAYGNPFTIGQVRQVTPQRPRTVGLRLAAAF
jgi:outer membrane receptor protein involved in Fe transport